MKFIDIIESAKSASALFDTKTKETTALLQSQVSALLDRIRELPADHDPLERAQMLLDTARNLVLLEEEGNQAWAPAREAFDIFATAQDWEKAVECCDAMYLSGHPDALVALGQGVWLAVTFPVNPELSVSLLEHVVDDTPDTSDGAAVAAMTAHYIADIRSDDAQRENLSFFTGQLLAKVARRHSEIDSQAKFDWWLNKLELNDPALFLPRLRNVVDVLVQEHWWIDRDAIHASLPVN